MFQAKIKKWGNSYGLIIPKDEALKLKENASVYVNLTQPKSARDLGIQNILKGKNLMSAKEFKAWLKTQE